MKPAAHWAVHAPVRTSAVQAGRPRRLARAADVGHDAAVRATGHRPSAPARGAPARR